MQYSRELLLGWFSHGYANALNFQMKLQKSFVIARGFILDRNRSIPGRYSVKFKATKFGEILLAVTLEITKLSS